jgi:hypothetical protein
LKRLIMLIVLGLAASGGAAIGAGHGTALAQVPPGNTNACARHAANNGNSYAYDLACASLTIIAAPIPGAIGQDYQFDFIGSGLQPGSPITGFNITSGRSTVYGSADGNGNFSFTGRVEACSVGAFQFYLTGITAAGTPIQSVTGSYPPPGAC